MTNEIMQEFEKIKVELDALVLEGKKTTEIYQKEVDAAMTNKEEATQVAIKTKQNGDAQAYIKASQEMRNAQDMEQFYLDKLDGIKNDPYITGTELKQYRDRIKLKLDSINHSKKIRAGELLKELVEIRNEVAPVFDEGDKTLYKLNHEVLRDNLKPAGSDDRYDDRTLIQWIDMITRQYPAQQLMEYIDKGGN